MYETNTFLDFFGVRLRNDESSSIFERTNCPEFGGWEQSVLVLPWYYRVGHHGNTMVIPWLPWYYHGYEITEYGFTMVITMVLGWF